MSDEQLPTPIETTPAPSEPEAPKPETETDEDDASFLEVDPKDEAPSDEKEEAKEEKPEDAPKEEAFEYAIPEGFKEEDIDKGMYESFVENAKKFKLPKEAHDTFFKMHAQGIDQYQTALLEAWKQKRESWRSEIHNDPDIGGEKVNQTRLVIEQMLKTVGGKDEIAQFKQAMGETGAGDNPIVVKMLTRVANMVSEGGYVTGRVGHTDNRSASEKMYEKRFEQIEAQTNKKKG